MMDMTVPPVKVLEPRDPRVTSRMQTSVQSPVLGTNTPSIAQNMVPTANAMEATCCRGTSVVESTGKHPLITKSLGAHTLGPHLFPSERLVGSPDRVLRQDIPQLRGHSSVAIIIVTITAIIAAAHHLQGADAGLPIFLVGLLVLCILLGMV